MKSVFGLRKVGEWLCGWGWAWTDGTAEMKGWWNDDGRKEGRDGDGTLLRGRRCAQYMNHLTALSVTVPGLPACLAGMVFSGLGVLAVGWSVKTNPERLIRQPTQSTCPEELRCSCACVLLRLGV